MQAAAEYRKYAQECIESARIEISDAVRTQFLELGKVWLSAATRLELRKERDGKIVEQWLKLADAIGPERQSRQFC
jgi:hypothetical protein